MEENKNVTTEITYEQLENAYKKLYVENMQLAKKYEKLTSVFNILPYYIEVVKSRDKFDPEFVHNCEEQLRSILTPTPEESEENKGE